MMIEREDGDFSNDITKGKGQYKAKIETRPKPIPTRTLKRINQSRKRKIVSRKTRLQQDHRLRLHRKSQEHPKYKTLLESLPFRNLKTPMMSAPPPIIQILRAGELDQ